MGAHVTPSTAKTSEPSPLYLHERYDAYECLGCGEMIEIPRYAVIKAGLQPVEIKGNPENLLCWRELVEIDHAPCIHFTDATMAQQAREHRRPIMLHASRLSH